MADIKDTSSEYWDDSRVAIDVNSVIKNLEFLEVEDLREVIHACEVLISYKQI